MSILYDNQTLLTSPNSYHIMNHMNSQKDLTTAFFYLRDEKNHPYGAVAMRHEQSGIRVSYSLCNPLDEFNKRCARNKTLGRLLSKTQSKVFNPSRVNLRSVFRKDLSQYLPNQSKMETLFLVQLERLQKDNETK